MTETEKVAIKIEEVAIAIYKTSPLGSEWCDLRKEQRNYYRGQASNCLLEAINFVKESKKQP